MTVPSKVRNAGPDDYPELWRLFLQNHKENGLFPLAPEKVQWVLNRVLYPQAIPLGDTGLRGVVGVIGPVGALEAVVFVTISEYWYSHQKHLEEFMVYVDPECRKSGHAVALVDWMKSQSRITELPLLTGIMSNDRTEAKCRLYRRMLPKIGELFMVSPVPQMSLAASSSG